MKDDQRVQIETLYLEMFERLIAYARSSLENEDLAEEAVQNTFQIACQKPDELCNSPNPQGWLMLTLRNTVRNMISSRATAKRIVEAYLLPQFKEPAVWEDPVDLSRQYGDIANTEEFKLLLEMAVEGKTHKEIALSRGISIQTCRKRMQRAKEILRKKIQK